MSGLALAERIAECAADLARRSFAWIVKEQSAEYSSRRSQLQMLKNTSYAWRQALFFLSFADVSESRRTIDELKTRVSAEPVDWRNRFEPVVAGLEAIVAGDRFDTRGRVGLGRRFLGWSVGPHWLLRQALAQHSD